MSAPELRATMRTVLDELAFDLFDGSLARLGILALGHKESLRTSAHAERYEELDAAERLYRKVR